MIDTFKIPLGRTLEECYDTLFGNFEHFYRATGGLLYNEETESGQLQMVFFEDSDTLDEYFDYVVMEAQSDGNRLLLYIKRYFDGQTNSNNQQ